jgi:hypothetical protein
MFLDGTPQVARSHVRDSLRAGDVPPGGGVLSPQAHHTPAAPAVRLSDLSPGALSPRQETRKARWREVLGSPGGTLLLSPASVDRASEDGGSTRYLRRASGAAELAAADVTPTAPASLFATPPGTRDAAEHPQEAELLMLQRDAAAALRHALIERTAERDAAIARLAVAQGALEDAAALEDELRSLRRALADARAETAREAREQEAAQMRVDEALGVASEASAEVDKLTGEARAARAESARLAADTRRLAAELAGARKESDAAMRDRAAAEAQLEGERETTRTLRDQLARLDAGAAEKVRAAAAAARSKAKAEAAAELNAAVRDTADRGRQLVDERVSAAVSAAVATEREAAASLRVRLTSVTSERDAALDMVRRLQQQLETVTARLGSAEDALSQATAERDAAQAQASRDGDVATELVAERAAMEEEVAAAAQRALDAERQRDAALGEARAAKAALKRAEFLQAEEAAASAASREQTERIAHLNAELASRDAELEAMRASDEAMETRMSELQRLLHHHQSLAVEATTAALSAQDALAASQEAAREAMALAQQRQLELDASSAQLDEARATLAVMAAPPVSPAQSERIRMSHGDLFGSPPSVRRTSAWSAVPGDHPDLELQLAEARVALDVTGTDLTLAVNALEQTAGELDASRAEASALLAERDTAHAELEVARQHAQRCHAAQELTVAQTQLVAALSSTGAPRSVYEEVLTLWIADGRATEKDLLERLAHAEQQLARALERESLLAARQEIAGAAARWESPARQSLPRASAASSGISLQPQSETSPDEGAFPLAFVSVPVAHSAQWATAGMEDELDDGQSGEAAVAYPSRESVTLAVRLPPTDPAAVLQLREELHDALQRAAAAEEAVTAVVRCAREALNTCPVLDVDADTATPPWVPAADAAVEEQEQAACECIEVLMARALRATALVDVKDSRLRALDLALGEKSNELARLTAAAAAAPPPAEAAAEEAPKVVAFQSASSDVEAQLERLRVQLEQARHEARAASVERMAAQQELIGAIGERNAALAKSAAATQARDALAADMATAAEQLQAARADALRLLQWCQQAVGVGEGNRLASPGQPHARMSSAAAVDVDSLYPEAGDTWSPLLADPPTPMTGRRLEL